MLAVPSHNTCVVVQLTHPSETVLSSLFGNIVLLLCLQIYFPTVYDIKYLMKFCDNLHGGLNKLAEVLQVERLGPQHQVCLAWLFALLAAALQIMHICSYQYLCRPCMRLLENCRQQYQYWSLALFTSNLGPCHFRS